MNKSGCVEAAVEIGLFCCASSEIQVQINKKDSANTLDIIVLLLTNIFNPLA